jgi:hypothetical protein
MDLASIRVMNDGLGPVTQFYEQVTGASAVRPAPVFAERRVPSCTNDAPGIAPCCSA